MSNATGAWHTHRRVRHRGRTPATWVAQPYCSAIASARSAPCMARRRAAEAGGRKFAALPLQACSRFPCIYDRRAATQCGPDRLNAHLIASLDRRLTCRPQAQHTSLSIEVVQARTRALSFLHLISTESPQWVSGFSISLTLLAKFPSGLYALSEDYSHRFQHQPSTSGLSLEFLYSPRPPGSAILTPPTTEDNYRPSRDRDDVSI